MFSDSDDIIMASSNTQPFRPESALSSQSKRMRFESQQSYFDEDERAEINIENFPGSFVTYIENSSVQEEVRRMFRWFLKSFRLQSNQSQPFYLSRIRRMARQNGASLTVDYKHVGEAVRNIAIWLADYPEKILPLLSDAAFEVTENAFPNYRRIQPEIFVRVSGLPIEDKIRELRQLHLGRLVRVPGVVTKRTSVFPQLKTVRFNCVKCSYLTLPFVHSSCDSEAKPPPRCNECKSKGPFRVNQEETLYRNFQRISLQESPGSVPAGRVPRRKEVVLTNDLIDTIRPGEEVIVTGIYKNQFEVALNTRHGFPVFATMIEANHIQRVNHQLEVALKDSDMEKIREFSKKPNICEIIISSIAPSIHGHKSIKEALALALFGGTAKEADKGRHRLRGDINVLILGDPGTAKSQFLKYIEKAAPRAVYSTGKGASAVGLTAAVQKDPKTREWVLEGGALVLADQGVCLIDEFDKMNEHDRTSIHEAMEQQTISISKAGIVATLQARCSVVAVANPAKERYDGSETFFENVDLSDAIISRFDIVRVVKDTVDPFEDEKLAQFVLESHVKSHPSQIGRKNKEGEEGEMSNVEGLMPSQRFHEDKEKIPQDLLRKYISFARKNIKPRINEINQHKLIQVYKDLRKESMREGAIPIGVRHIESIIRMSEARAKMHLRENVTNSDLDAAIGVVVRSFVESQKFSVMRAMKRRFRRFLHAPGDNDELLFHVLTELFKDEMHVRTFLAERSGEKLVENEDLEVDVNEFEEKARQLEVFDVTPFYDSAVFRGTFGVNRQTGRIKKL